jgi:hypothetical protein
MNVAGKTIFTNGGVPAFHGVSFQDIESLPFTPLGTSTLASDFNGLASSPTQASYTGVLPTRLYGTGTPGADYGWLTQSPAGFDRGSGSTSPFASLLRDGQYGTTDAAGARTFQADVTNGYYLVSVKMGDLSVTRDQMRVTNADTGQIVLNNLTTPAGQVLETSFVINVTDGTMDLTFSDQGGADPYWTLNGLDIRPAVLLTEGFAPQGPFPADGVTVDTFTVVGVTPGAEVTVSTNLGTITSPDVDPSVVGIQLLANGSGQANVNILRPTGGGMALVLFEEVSGAQTGCGLVTYALQDTRRFDFNAPSSPTQLPSAPPTVGGYIGVLPTDTYTAARGFGWLTAAAAFDRGAQSGTTRSDLLRDGHYGSAGGAGSRDFRIDLPPGGPFQVTVTMGDATVSRDQMSVSVITGTGTGLSGINTAAGQFFNGSFTVTPSGGAVVLRFADGGGDPYWVVNGLEVRPVAAVAPITLSGPGGSLQADGITTDTFTVTAASGALVTLSTDKGTITGVVDADARYAGVQVMGTGAAISFGILRPTSAGVATVAADEVTGASRGTFTQTYVVAATRRFDFNASNAPGVTATGFLPVRGSDTYTAARGFGWNVVVPEFDRGTASPVTVALYRDGHYGNAGPAGARTFRIQVDPGVYNLRVYVGDASVSRDNIRVSAEGGVGLIVVPNTAVNNFVSVTFTGQDVNADGILDVTIQDLGGDPYWVINGLDIWTTTDPGQAPQLAVGGAVTGRPDVAALTADQLQSIVNAAIARWAAAGLDAGRLATLQQVQFQIGNFGGSGVLGMTALGGRVVTLDATAAGHGWFIDPTPGDDSEFALAGGVEGRALAGSAASGRMDLLTVVEHELGHVLGLDDLGASSGDVMDVALAEGVRRLPGAADVDASFTAPPVPVAPSQPPAPVTTKNVVTTSKKAAVRKLHHVRRLRGRRGNGVHAAKAVPVSGTPGSLPPA